MKECYIQKHFSQAASSYDKESGYQYQMGKKLMRFFSQQNSKNIKNILDVGCGTGKLTYALAEHFINAKIDAIDISDGMIEFAQKHYGHSQVCYHTLSVNNLLGDEKKLSALNFKVGYDIIFSNASLHWFTDINEIFSLFCQLLSSQGEVLLNVYLNRTYANIQKAIRELYQHYSGTLSFPNKEEIIQGAKATNLTVSCLLEQEDLAWFDNFSAFRKQQKRLGTYNITEQKLSYQQSKKLHNWLNFVAFTKPFPVMYHVAYCRFNHND